MVAFDLSLVQYIHNYFSTEKDIILVILHSKFHWTLGVINISEKLICILDSNKHSSGSEQDNDHFYRLFWIAKMALHLKKEEAIIKEWTFSNPQRTPQQLNGSNDCGIFVCHWFEQILSGSYSLKQSTYTRKHIKEVIETKINGIKVANYQLKRDSNECLLRMFFPILGDRVSHSYKMITFLPIKKINITFKSLFLKLN
jgi:Ulp1 family protease